MGLLAHLGAVANATGVLEINVIFPHVNETYAPTENFPVIYALQNAKLAEHLTLGFFLSIHSRSSPVKAGGSTLYRDTDFSSEPYFVYYYKNLSTGRGYHQLFSHITWDSCDESSDEVFFQKNGVEFTFPFNIEQGGQEVDLIAATEKCTDQPGVTILVTDQKRKYFNSDFVTCSVLDSSSPTPTRNHCQVKIDAAAVASMSAGWHARSCRSWSPPDDCPKENAVQHLFVAGVASFAVAFGAIGFLLA